MCRPCCHVTTAHGRPRAVLVGTTGFVLESFSFDGVCDPKELTMVTERV